jgi:hypothetical protein
MVHMDSGTFMWVSIKRFSIESDGTDEELIAALLADRQYRDHYAGQDPVEQLQDDLHGPYWLRAISISSFEPGDSETAKQALQAWADAPEPQTQDTQERLQREVYPLLKGGAVYHLPDLRPSAQHDWGWVVGQGGFHEYVVVDRDAASVSLIVASDD